MISVEKIAIPVTVPLPAQPAPSTTRYPTVSAAPLAFTITPAHPLARAAQLAVIPAWMTLPVRHAAKAMVFMTLHAVSVTTAPTTIHPPHLAPTVWNTV